MRINEGLIKYKLLPVLLIFSLRFFVLIYFVAPRLESYLVFDVFFVINDV